MNKHKGNLQLGTEGEVRHVLAVLRSPILASATPKAWCAGTHGHIHGANAHMRSSLCL